MQRGAMTRTAVVLAALAVALMSSHALQGVQGEAKPITMSAAAKTALDEHRQKQHGYVTLKIVDDEVVPDEFGAREKTLEELEEHLLENFSNQCRFVVVNFEDKCNLMTTWCGQDTNVDEKILYGATFEAVWRSFYGCQVRFDTSEAGDYTDESVGRMVQERLNN